MTLIVTDYGAFTSQGSSQAVPVKYFAGFYITGWDKNGNNPECADNEPHPWYPSGYRKSLDNGDVWGHFINVVVFSVVRDARRQSLQLRRGGHMHRRPRRVAALKEPEFETGVAERLAQYEVLKPRSWRMRPPWTPS